MKSYELAKTKAKREVQSRLFKHFSKIENPQLTALAGSNPFAASIYYRKYIPASNIILVDINPVSRYIRRGYIENFPASNIMDVDLEITILNGQYTIMNVFYNMNTQVKGLKALCFTVSTRGANGRNNALTVLNNTLFKNTLQVSRFEQEFIDDKRYIVEIIHTQTCFLESKLYCYKDSSQMLSGIILWK